MKIRLSSKVQARSSQIAYTLAEVMIATALLAILVVSLYGGMSSGFALTQASRENLRATQILLERMEGIRLYNWNQLVYSNWGVPGSFTSWYYPMTNRNESPGIMYAGRISLKRNPALSPGVCYLTNLCLVTVSVNWNSGGVPRSRSLSTYVSRNGVQNYVYNSTNYNVP